MRLLLGIILSILLGASNVYAEILAVSIDQAEIRSSPTVSGSRVTILAPRYYPLHILGVQGEFFKVNDFQNNSGWVSKASVDNTRSIVVNAESINVRNGPGTNHPVIFKAENGVTFKVVNQEGNWLQVEHESGITGWLFRNLVWGD